MNATLEARNGITSSLLEIFESMKQIDDSLIAVNISEARWAGIFVGGLVSILWAVVGMSLLSVLIPIPGGPNSTSGFGQFFLLTTIIPFLLLGPIAGLLTYFYARKSYTKRFVLHKKTLQGLAKTVKEQKVKEANVVEKTLRLVDQISRWMPKLLRYKGDEALGYGFAAFLVVAFVSLLFSASSVGLPISLLVGVIVWLYFRYEKRKEVEGQIQELKNWKQKFEEGKRAFLETM